MSSIPALAVILCLVSLTLTPCECSEPATNEQFLAELAQLRSRYDVSSMICINPRPLLPPKVCPDMFPLARGASCYAISVVSTDFNSAKAACEAMGGKLAEIEDAGENEFLKLYARLDGTVGYWIGGSDQASEGTFKWVSDGRPITWFDWTPGGQPDNAGNEDCIELRVVSPFNSRWNDHQCHLQKRYICETNLD